MEVVQGLAGLVQVCLNVSQDSGDGLQSIPGGGIGFVDKAAGAAEDGIGVAQKDSGGGGCVGGVTGKLVGAGEDGLGGVIKPRQGIQRCGRRTQLPPDGLTGRLQLGNQRGPVHAHRAEEVGKVRQVAGDGLYKGGVHLLLHGGFCLAGYFGGNGVFLVVFVVVELRVYTAAGEGVKNILGEVVGHHQNRIAVALFQERHGLVLAFGKHPADGVVGLQGLQDLVADVHFQAQETSALVLGHHRHGDTGGGVGAVGIPVGKNIKPGVQARHHAQAQQDHNGHDAGGDPAQIAPENSSNGSHFSPSFSSAAVKERMYRSRCWALARMVSIHSGWAVCA